MPLRPTLRSEFERAERATAANARLKDEVKALREALRLGTELDNHHNAAMCPYCKPANGQREEWTIRHSQGVHPGPFTEEAARAWAANDIKADERRRPEARGKTQLLRRRVTEWEEVDS